MNEKTFQRVKDFVSALIAEGEDARKKLFSPPGNWVGGPPVYIDLEAFSKWRSKCRLLVPMLGKYSAPWEPVLNSQTDNQVTNGLELLGTLKGIPEAIDAGALTNLVELVQAEAFSDLLEQAEYLFKEGYFVAAGVLARGVLEERLRHLAVQSNCAPGKGRPTISDYNSELYKASVIDKPLMKQIDWMAAVGNQAAHVDKALRQDDVEAIPKPF